MNVQTLSLATLACAASFSLNHPIEASTEGLSQEAYLKSTNIGSDQFGSAVTVSGRFAVVSTTAEDSAGTGVNSTPDEAGENSGAAYVYERINGSWAFHSFLKASNTNSHDEFGKAAVLDGELLAISATGESSNATGVGGDESNNDSPNSGAVYVFRFDGNSWVQEAYLKASNPDDGDEFGFSLALDGNTLVVGAPDDAGPGSSAGSAYIFVRSGGIWTEQARINAEIFGNSDGFGFSVAIEGDHVVVGAPGEDGSATGVDGTVNDAGNNAGAAYLFTRNDNGEWSQTAYLKASNTDPEDAFGGSVTISGNTIAVGAVHERGSIGGINPASNNDILRTGAVYVFADNGTGWESQAMIKAGFPAVNDRFGNQVALAGDLLAVASLEESGASSGLDGDETTDGLASSGAVYLFSRTGTTWSQTRYFKASNAGSGDRFGSSLALHSENAGELLLVGAPFEDGSSPGINGEDNDLWGNSGAAYAFTIRRPVIGMKSGETTLRSGASLINFGRADIGGKSRPKRILVRNDGWDDLTRLRVIAKGKGRREFKLSQPAQKSLAPSQLTTFKITFRPSNRGKRRANLLVSSNAPKSNPFVLKLSGKGRAR